MDLRMDLMPKLPIWPLRQGIELLANTTVDRLMKRKVIPLGEQDR